METSVEVPKVKFIEPSFQFMGRVPLWTNKDLAPALRFNEECGRVCYKSEDKITDDSAPAFIKKAMNKKHKSVLEMSNLVARIFIDDDDVRTMIANDINADLGTYRHDVVGKHIVVVDDGRPYLFVGGNVRAWMDILQCDKILDYDYWSTDNFEMIEHGVKAYLYKLAGTFSVEVCDETDYIPHELVRFAIRFIHDRAFTHELVRHRPLSILQESQRYVRYETGIEMIIPYPFRKSGVMPANFIEKMNEISVLYRELLKDHPAQFARSGLPNCTKTEIIICTTPPHWEIIQGLRNHPAAHPDMREMMEQMVRPVMTLMQSS